MTAGNLVQTDEVHSGNAARQVLAGDAHRAVGLGAHRVDDRVIVPCEILGRDVLTHGDVAEEPEPWILSRLLEGPADRLDLGVVRSHPGTHQSPWGGQHFDHIDVDVGATGRH